MNVKAWNDPVSIIYQAAVLFWLFQLTWKAKVGTVHTPVVGTVEETGLHPKTYKEVWSMICHCVKASISDPLHFFFLLMNDVFKLYHGSWKGTTKRKGYAISSPQVFYCCASVLLWAHGDFGIHLFGICTSCTHCPIVILSLNTLLLLEPFIKWPILSWERLAWYSGFNYQL